MRNRDTVPHRYLDRLDVARALDRAPDCTVGVLGDYVVDAYYYLDNSRSEISIETGVRTRAVRDVDIRLGAAGNVARNARALGCRDVRAYGVVGDDLYGRELVRLCEAASIDARGIVVQHGDWQTGVYTKPYDGDVELERTDIGNFNVARAETTADVLRRLAADLPELDVVVVNQQLLAGVHTAEFRAALAGVIAAQPETPFIVDSRDYPDEYGSAIRKLNLDEALAVLGRDRDPDAADGADAYAVVEELAARWNTDVVLTLGADGCLVAHRGTVTVVPGLHVVGLVDTVGAGDALLAGLAVAVAARENTPDAAFLGNLCAGLSVTMEATGAVTAADVRETLPSPDVRHRPALAYGRAEREYHRETEIEVIAPIDAEVRVAVFDFDGTISTLREGWEEVMRAFMIDEIIGDAGEHVSNQKREAIDRRVREYIDQSTGVQTISQMEGLRDMIVRHGYVAPQDLREPLRYKELYLSALGRSVTRRLQKLEAGELTPDDVTVKGSLAFVRTLADSGFTLYLASGTDEPDVVREARALGCEQYFTGGIHGSRNDVAGDPKKIVLDRLLSGVASRGLPVITFGDGPVEIRETKKRRGYAVGVASDEIRRWGLNEKKRTRLVLAGADLIVADFSEHDALLRLLGVAPIAGAR